MKLASIFVANSADMNGDRLQVQGGLWDGLTASRFPAAHDIPVVVLLRPEPSDVGTSSHIDLHVTGPDGKAAGHSHMDVTLHQFKPQTAVVVSVRGSFPTPGRYTLALRSQIGTDEISFQVVGQGGEQVPAASQGFALGLDK